MNEGLLFALVAAVLALLYGIVSIKWILGSALPAMTACVKSQRPCRKALPPI